MKKLLFASLFIVACTRVDSDKVDTYAQEYAKHFPGSTGVECAKSDTDGDGYVTCTVFMGNEEPISIQCGAEKWCVANCAEGCKYVPTYKIDSRRRK